ncbi:hypothetical protein [Nocardia sp. R6R-6]|uniref:hypothetical protein n=1 Tax=Nocardia sp. R6R-6 TaxID=3459303 RepID=UPI00403DB512
MTGTALSSWPAPPRLSASAPPRAVRIAFVALVVALLAGVVEAIARAAVAFDADPADLAAGFGIRIAIYLVVLAVAMRMFRGERWARLLITVGVGVFGLLSLSIEPLATAMSAKELRDLVTDVTPASVTLGVIRAIHIAAVLVAVPALYTRGARRWFGKRGCFAHPPRSPHTEYAGSKAAERTTREPRRG